MLGVLERKNRAAERLLADPYLEEYIQAGIISVTEIRNCRIITDYIKLRKSQSHIDALDALHSKYFISPSSIAKVLY